MSGILANAESDSTWVERGGVLIGLGRANRFLSNQELLATAREHRAGEGQDKSEDEGPPAGSTIASAEDYEAAIAPSWQSLSHCPV